MWSLLQQGRELCGMDAVVSGNIPIGAGLSSSAAIEVAVGFTLLQLSESEINLKELALAAKKAENDFVGMRCGMSVWRHSGNVPMKFQPSYNGERIM